MGGPAPRLLAPLVLLLAAGCGADAVSTLILVSLTGVPEDADALRATSYLDGQPEQEPALFPAKNTSFLIRLPPGQGGRYRLEAEALGQDQCTFAQAVGELAVHGESRLDLSIPFSKRLDFHVCALTVHKTGRGSGYVESSPGDIRCGAPQGDDGAGRCAGQFQQGVTVLLTATAQSGAVFDGWSGACAGLGACRVTMAGPASVTASFSAKVP